MTKTNNEIKQAELSEHDKRIAKKMRVNLLMVFFLVVPVMSYFFLIKPIMTQAEILSNPLSANNSRVIKIIDEAEKPEYKAFNSSLLSVAKDATDDNIVTEKEYDAVMVEYEYFLKKSAQ